MNAFHSVIKLCSYDVGWKNKYAAEFLEIQKDKKKLVLGAN